MKQNFKILTLLVIGLCAFQNVFGQQNLDDHKKFREIIEKSRILRNASDSYRIRTTQKIYTDEGKTLKSTVTSISEYAKPDRWSYSSTTDTGGKTKKYESISIGEKSYVRENDGEWKARTTEGLYGLAAVGFLGIELIEQTTFEGQRVSVYEETLRRMVNDESRNEKTRYWINEQGRLLKEETEEENLSTRETLRTVRIYEYDVKVKIEAPVK